jgi:hypothetical protein
VAAAAVLLVLGVACKERQPPRSSGGDARREDDAAPYQAEVEEGIGAAVAILVDTSGSMKEPAPGDSRPSTTSRSKQSRRCSRRRMPSSQSARIFPSR